MWPITRRHFRVRNISDISPNKYDPYTVRYSIMWSTAADRRFLVIDILEQNIYRNYLLVTYCVIMITRERLYLCRNHFFKQNRYCKHKPSLHVFPSHHQLRIFLSKWVIHTNNTIIRTIHLFNVIPLRHQLWTIVWKRATHLNKSLIRTIHLFYAIPLSQ
jgi:hypothetical protein